jgi:homoserine O-acetyltransferase
MREESVAIGALRLDCGQTLAAVEQFVTIYGAPAADGSNVVLVEHALTGSSRAADWWPGIVGEGALFDPREWCVVGINALGSCYGSTKTSARITVRDIVRAEMQALHELGLERVELVIGGSLGGMRALQWALDAAERVGAAVLVGAHDHHSAMGIALNSLQREALALDPVRGLRLARKLALLSYKSEELFNERHGRRRDRHGRPCFDVEGYLDRHAVLFEARMDADSYVALTHAMDSFDVRAGDVFPPPSSARNPALTFVGITSDWLFRPQDVRAAAQRFALRGFDARYLELRSRHGHDAFLAEPAALRALLEPLISAPVTAGVRRSLC